jgi:hypothetical protein
MSGIIPAAAPPAACPLSVPPLPPLPRGLAPWLAEWIDRTRREAQFLADRGAHPQAVATGCVLVSLIESAREWLDAEVDTAQAAVEAGCSEETVRRAVRDHRLESRRSSERGRNRIRRGDLGTLRKGYDPAADAVSLSARRMSQ